jgi:hypothetical protein
MIRNARCLGCVHDRMNTGLDKTTTERGNNSQEHYKEKKDEEKNVR